MPRAPILQFKKALSLLCEQIPKPVAVSLKRYFSGSEFQTCLHTFQCPGTGSGSVGKTAPSLQSTKLYCFRDILCHSLSHGLIINIYAFSKWICCANKHWCFVFFFQYFMSGMPKLDCTLTGNTIHFSSIDSGVQNHGKLKNKYHNCIVLIFPFYSHSPV